MEIYTYIYIYMVFQLKFVLGLGLNSPSFQLDGKMQLGVGVRGPYLPLGINW